MLQHYPPVHKPMKISPAITQQPYLTAVLRGISNSATFISEFYWIHEKTYTL